MDFQQLVELRQSVRKYSDKPLEKEKLQCLVEAVHLAPSACNSQPWKVIIVDDEAVKNKLAKASFNELVSFNKFALEAPVIAVLVIEKAKWIARIGGTIKNQEYPEYDIGIAAAHFCLQAAEIGLGTCMIGWFDDKKVREILQIPKKRKVALLISLGYPAENYKQRKKIRKPLNEIVAYNAYT